MSGFRSAARAALCVSAVLALPACTTVAVQENTLPMSSMNHCAAPVGVSVRYGTLTIALGDRPSTGYGVQIVGQQEDSGEYEFIYRETKPQAGLVYAQMITQPCAQLILPKDWQQVTVRHEINGSEIMLTPLDDTGLYPDSAAQ